MLSQQHQVNTTSGRLNEEQKKRSTIGLRSPLTCSSPRLNHTLKGGLKWGQLVDWGIPYGQDGRRAILPFIVAATNAGNHCLWAHDHKQLTIYPPAWYAMGVDLDYIHFARSYHTQKPTSFLEDIKPAVLSRHFRLLVLDGHLNRNDYSFLARQARNNNSIIITISQRLLQAHDGNVWARQRLNSWHHPMQECFVIQTIKGCEPEELSLPESELI